MSPMRPVFLQIWRCRQPANHVGLPRRGFQTSSFCLSKRYTDAHEWVELSEDQKIATIGISSYAQHQLGDVVFVELPTADQEVSAGDAIGAVESVKSASDIYAPISGTIIESNSALDEKPGIINKQPESEGWIAKLEVKDPKELESLMDEDAYKKHNAE